MFYWRVNLCDSVECFEKRCEYCLKGVSCFDAGGRVCFHVVLIRVDDTVCTYEKVILFAWIHYGGNNWQNKHEISNKITLGCS